MHFKKMISVLFISIIMLTADAVVDLSQSIPNITHNTVAYAAKSSSGGFKSGGFKSSTPKSSAPKSGGTSDFKSGQYTTPKQQAPDSKVNPPAGSSNGTNGTTNGTNYNNQQNGSRSSWFPMFIPMPFGFGGGMYGGYSPFGGLFQLILLVAIGFGIFWLYRRYKARR
ncbi:MAG: hypothetical protein H7Y41_03995 [Hyphomonadaceae bacterium]|nr:hypothetical protein [Clostridia bacterium]